MLKNHPKGLVGAALANMGERFGFYIMMAILMLFLTSKFGIGDTLATVIYSIFYALIYVLALVGGIIADRTKKYKRTIFMGLVLMTLGYAFIAIPTQTPVPNIPIYLGITCLGLLVIAFGNGLFKGNLQAVVGQLYDNDQYRDKRDSGFQIFYMFINIGAMFAPIIAIAIRNLWLKSYNFLYEAKLPELCHQYIDGTITSEGTARLTEYANAVSIGGFDGNVKNFVYSYIDVFNVGFQYAFGAAVIAMIVSMVIWVANRRTLPDPAAKAAAIKEAGASAVTMDAKEVKQRLYALFSVFAVVIFFWFSFHQNGAAMTLYAKDYVDLSWIYINLGAVEIKGAEIFQSINPLCVVFLTPIVIGVFGWLRAKGKEPSTPKKIAIGMFIAAVAFVVMVVGSLSLPDYASMKAHGVANPASPWVLIGTYFILTMAELFISPLGISFVSKVAPPHLQGRMQGMWLGATAVGNQLLFIGVLCYEYMPQWATWSVFVVACLLSMFTMLLMLKWLEKVAK